MKKLCFILVLLSANFINALAQNKPKSDSVVYLSPYVVVGLNPKQVQVSGSYSLYVPKGILTERVRVAVKNSNSWADYVFDETYPLKPIAEVEAYIQQNKHLPDVPSTADVVRGGLDLGDGQRILLQKVEELTLYIIQQEKRIKALESKLNAAQPKH
jgi:hypothetical protein